MCINYLLSSLEEYDQHFFIKNQCHVTWGPQVTRQWFYENKIAYRSWNGFLCCRDLLLSWDTSVNKCFGKLTGSRFFAFSLMCSLSGLTQGWANIDRVQCICFVPSTTVFWSSESVFSYEDIHVYIYIYIIHYICIYYTLYMYILYIIYMSTYMYITRIYINLGCQKDRKATLDCCKIQRVHVFAIAITATS